MKNIAVILAAGSGTRFGLSTPKQFFKVAGKTVLEHAVQVFEEHEAIDEIAVVAAPECVDRVEDLILRNGWKKVRKVLFGGKERYESSLSAVRAYAGEGDDVRLIFHDSARPLLSPRVITDVCAKLGQFNAVDVAVPAVDTIIQVDEAGGCIDSIPNRGMLRCGQTPQGFRLGTIRRAYELALKDPAFRTTDDCGVVVKYLPEEKVAVVAGESSNIKLTNPEDAYLIDKLFQIRSSAAKAADLAGLNGKVMVIFGGSSGIGRDMEEIAKVRGCRVRSFSRSQGGIDVARLEDVQDALKQVHEEEGRIDFVVNTAAILRKEPLLTQSAEIINAVVQTNLVGAVNTTLAAYPYLKESGGSVLQFASSSYTQGRAFYALYSASKAAVVNFVQAMADEWRSDGITLNCINPQRTKTPMREKNFGIEDPSTLLKSEDVARISLQVLLSEFSGEVVDIKLA